MRQRWLIAPILVGCVSAGAALAQPAFTASKTVGTVPGVCAPTGAIVVPPGANNVTYCYTITSLLGNSTMYSLTDDRLGSLVANATLGAGATAQILVNTLVNGSVTNVATWTVAGFSSQVASAQVNVGADVPTLADVGLVALGLALAAAGVLAVRGVRPV